MSYESWLAEKMGRVAPTQTNGARPPAPLIGPAMPAPVNASAAGHLAGQVLNATLTPGQLMQAKSYVGQQLAQTQTHPQMTVAQHIAATRTPNQMIWDAVNNAHAIASTPAPAAPVVHAPMTINQLMQLHAANQPDRPSGIDENWTPPGQPYQANAITKVDQGPTIADTVSAVANAAPAVVAPVVNAVASAPAAVSGAAPAVAKAGSNAFNDLEHRVAVSAKTTAAGFQPAIDEIAHPVRTAQHVASDVAQVQHPLDALGTVVGKAKEWIGEQGEEIGKPQKWVENEQATLAYKALNGDKVAQAAVSFLRGNNVIGTAVDMSGGNKAERIAGAVLGGAGLPTQLPGKALDVATSKLGMNLWDWSEANKTAVTSAYEQGYVKKDKNGKVLESYGPGAEAVSAMFNDSMNFLQGLGYTTLTDPLLYVQVGAGPVARTLEAVTAADDAGIVGNVVAKTANAVGKVIGGVDTGINKVPEEIISNAVGKATAGIHAVEDAVPVVKTITDYFDPAANPNNALNNLRRDAGSALDRASQYVKDHLPASVESDVVDPLATASTDATATGAIDTTATASGTAATGTAPVTNANSNASYLFPKEGGTRSIDVIPPETYNAIKAEYEPMAEAFAGQQAALDAGRGPLSPAELAANRAQKVFNDMRFTQETNDLITRAGGSPIPGFTPRYEGAVPKNVLGSDGVWDAADKANAKNWIDRWTAGQNGQGGMLGEAMGAARDEVSGLVEVALGADPVAANDVRALFSQADDPNFRALAGQLSTMRDTLYKGADTGLARGDLVARDLTNTVQNGGKIANLSPVHTPPGSSRRFFDATLDDGAIKRVGGFARTADATAARDDLLATHTTVHGADAAPTNNLTPRAVSDPSRLPNVAKLESVQPLSSRIVEVSQGVDGTGRGAKFWVKFDDDTVKRVGGFNTTKAADDARLGLDAAKGTPSPVADAAPLDAPTLDNNPAPMNAVEPPPDESLGALTKPEPINATPADVTTPADKAAAATLPPNSGITPADVMDRGGFTPFDESGPRVTAGGNVGAVQSLSSGKALPSYWHSLSDVDQELLNRRVNFGGKFADAQELTGSLSRAPQDVFKEHLGAGMSPRQAAAQVVKDLAPGTEIAVKNSVRDALLTASRQATPVQTDLLAKTVLRDGSTANDFLARRIAAGDTEAQALTATMKQLPVRTTGVESQAIRDALQSSRTILTPEHNALLTDGLDFGGSLRKTGKQELTGHTERRVGDVFDEHLQQGLSGEDARRRVIEGFSPDTPIKDRNVISKFNNKLTQFSRENRQYGVLAGQGPMNLVKQQLGDRFTMATSGHLGAAVTIDRATADVIKSNVLNNVDNVLANTEYALDSARLGTSESRLTGLANRSETDAQEMTGRRIARRLGMKGKIGDVVGGAFGSERIRDLLEMQDLTRRIATMTETRDAELATRIPQFQSTIRDVAERTGGDADSLISGLGDRWSGDDIRRLAPEAGFEPGQTERMARDWINEVGNVQDAAYEEQKRIHFDFSPSQADELLKKGFLFHTWGLRAAPLYLRNSLENPALMNAYQHIADGLKRDCENRAGSTCGYLQLAADATHGFTLYNSPTSLISSMFINLDPDYNDVNATFLDTVMSRVPASVAPGMQGILTALGLSSHQSDILGLQRERKVWGGVVNYARANGWLGEGAKHSLGDPIYQKAMEFPEKLVAAAADWVNIHQLPTGVPLGEFTDPNAAKLVLLHNRMVELVFHDYNIPANTSMDDVERLYPKAYDALLGPDGAYNAWATQKPNAYADQAYRDLSAGLLTQAIATTIVPGGNLLHDTAKDDRALALADAKDAGDQTTVDALNSQSNVTTVASNPAAIDLQDQSGNVSAAVSPADKEWSDAYNAIRYGADPTTVLGVDKPDGSGVMTKADYDAMTPDQRTLLADQWASSLPAGPAAQLARARSEKKAAIAANPAYAAYQDWASAVRDLTPVQLQGVLGGNAGFKRYVDDLPAATKQDPDKYASAIASQDAYQAFNGVKAGAYDVDPVAPGGGGGGLTLPASSAGSGSGAKKSTNYGDYVLQDAQKYQAQMAQYQMSVQTVTGNPNTDVSQLNPMLRDAVYGHLSQMGVYEPDVPSSIKRYQAWSDAMAADGKPTDLSSYNDYMANIQANLDGIGANMTADQMLDAMLAGYNPFTGAAMGDSAINNPASATSAGTTP